LLESSFPAFYQKFKSDILDVDDFRDDVSVVVPANKIREMIQFAKTEPSLDLTMLMDLFGLDYLKYSLETPERFAVVYILFSLKYNTHLRLKVFLPEENPEIDSIHDIHKAANWNEREVWDLFGVNFRNHPNLIRILCHNDFVGHPLRKDYPSDQYQRLKNAASSSGF